MECGVIFHTSETDRIQSELCVRAQLAGLQGLCPNLDTEALPSYRFHLPATTNMTDPDLTDHTAQSDIAAHPTPSYLPVLPVPPSPTPPSPSPPPPVSASSPAATLPPSPLPPDVPRNLTPTQRKAQRLSSLSKSNSTRNTWDPAYALAFGLEPGRDASGFYAACRFCISFERVFEDEPPPAAKKRRRVVKGSHVVKYRNYRTDSIKRHLVTAHRSQWDAYRVLAEDDRRNYFVVGVGAAAAAAALQTLPQAVPASAATQQPQQQPGLAFTFAPFSASPSTTQPVAGAAVAASTAPQVVAALGTLLDARRAKIAVIGLGYVGLPLALTFHGAGLTVVGFDTDADKVHALNAGRSYIRHVSDARVSVAAASKSWRACCDGVKDIVGCDVVVICLPTPVGSHDEPDMRYVVRCVEDVRRLVLRKGVLVVLESTTYPGATDSEVVKILEGGEDGLRCGQDFFLAFSPEREDPGNTSFKTVDIPKLVGGVDKASGMLASLLYRRGGFRRVEEVSCARVAECAKLLENSYRAVNIALVNELKGVFRSMGVDIWEVLDAAETKPFGYQRFDPGPGIGGHCIPVDPFYLAWKARETGDACSFITLAAQVNAAQPDAVVTRVQEALNDVRKSVRGSKVLLLGVAYKANVDDIRCAPALDVWAGLQRLGAEVSYHDPYVPFICATRKHPALAGEKSVEFTRFALSAAGYDSVVVITHHDCFGKYEELGGFAGPVVDTRHRVPRWPGLVLVAA